MQLRRCLTFSYIDRRCCKEPTSGYRLAEPIKDVHVVGLGVVTMSVSLKNVVAKYLAAKKLSTGTCKEYRSTVTKWIVWGHGVDIDQIERTHIREFLDWVHDEAMNKGGFNAGRTANKARENLRAILSWAFEQDYL